MSVTNKMPVAFDAHQQIARFERFMARQLPALTQSPTRLHQAMHYAVLGPGKRLRPLLVYASGSTFKVERKTCDPLAAAVECIHAYSLIHDDLPAMDDDDLRRGRPTCHKAFDEATAILAGDALQSLAFALLVRAPHDAVCASDTSHRQVQCVRMLGIATGSCGMAGGQMMDMQSATLVETEQDLAALHRMKTGALIRASILMPAQFTNDLTAKERAYLAVFADAIGLGFQIQDDILDVVASSEQTGKSSGTDARHAKLTYPHLLGLDVAKARANDCLTQSLDALASIAGDTRALAELAKQMVQRQR